MGLAIEVGVLADLLKDDEDAAEWQRESFANANAVLAEMNLPTHQEPESLPSLDNRSSIDSFPYSFLHHLRRAYAHWRKDPSVLYVPCVEGEDPANDPLVDEISNLFDSHLLCHSDCEGCYFPLDFTEIIIDESGEDRIEGRLLGSSYRLHEELIAMAPCLGIDGTANLTKEQVEHIQEIIDGESDNATEVMVWFALFEACRLSKQHGTAICFC